MFRFNTSIALLCLAASSAAAYEPGDQLVVARAIEMKTLSGSMHPLTPGTPVTVRSVENGKLKVAAPRVGWIDASAVIAAKDADAYFSQQIEKGSDKGA